MKLLQVILAFIGGSAAIYAGIGNGYSVGLVAVLTAYFGTVIIPDTYRSLAARARRNRRTD